ncbi:acetylserotonin O-methyltransferase [Blastopirellula sp. JC732]|uniref:Acetylserotonin O-methyltransferase n=1 Tax=Blastopirellula sediminis TaxID=2894196 RepID=A0A9X1MQ37_9BACT|nr:acetylserotonin O-methyltransferase [Blastopirellula sediminis]MCC9605855.1 acetylserotonin O-methyltransferase [Blastopirellula sediminis]MCC9630846.1 acetylserotonin O-methyltransferase [Blastopirellula sediminis]
MSSVSPLDQLMQMISGYQVSQIVMTVSEMGIADLLKKGPASVEVLAQQCGAKPERLYRLLRAAASVGVFAETDPGIFTMTPLAEPLQSDHPLTLRPFAIMMLDEHYVTWGRLGASVKSDENAFEAAYGEPFFDFLGKNPKSAAIFDAAMTSIHGRETEAILDAYDFSQFGTIADVGGGNGSKLIAVLQKHPQLCGMLFDLPHVVERAAPNFTEAKVDDRMTLVGGDFFAEVPSGADAYMMRHIIHDWDDEKSALILKNCRAAMKPGQKLLLVEYVIPAGNDPFFGKLLDLTMMLIPGGKERTESEYRDLLASCGFRLDGVINTSQAISVLESFAV